MAKGGDGVLRDDPPPLARGLGQGWKISRYFRERKSKILKILDIFDIFDIYPIFSIVMFKNKNLY